MYLLVEAPDGRQKECKSVPFSGARNEGGMYQRVCKACPARTQKQHAASKELIKEHLCNAKARATRPRSARVCAEGIGTKAGG